MSTKLNSPLAVLLTVVMALSLSACGAGNDPEPYADTQMSSTGVKDLPVNATAVPTAAAINANTPAPDCAPENCSSLRIIDGNAEAWRADAAKREARADADFAQ